MAADQSPFPVLEQRLRELRLRSERDDFNNEMSELDVGRVKRFSGGWQGSKARRERGERLGRQMNALQQILLADRDYKQLYDDTADAIDRAREAARRAMEILNGRIDLALERLDDMRESAGRLPDDTRVFRDKQGRYLTEDGRELSAAEIALVTWPNGNPPSWEAFRAAQEDFEEAVDEREEVITYEREVLDPAERELTDGDNPPSRERLEEIQTEMERRAPPAMRAVTVAENPPVAENEAAQEDPAPLELGDLASLRPPG